MRNNIKFGYISPFYVSKTPIFKDDNFTLIKQIILKGNHVVNNKNIINSNDLFSIEEFNSAKIINNKSYLVQNSTLDMQYWENIKLKIINHDLLLNEKINVKLKGNDKYSETINLSDKKIFHLGHREELFYDSSIAEFKIPKVPISTNDFIHPNDTLHITFNERLNKQTFPNLKRQGFTSIETKDNKKFTLILIKMKTF